MKSDNANENEGEEEGQEREGKNTVSEEGRQFSEFFFLAQEIINACRVRQYGRQQLFRNFSEVWFSQKFSYK
jgi:hypothetical protein